MKPRFLLPLCAVVFCASSAIADDTPLAKQMEALNDSYKAFRKTENAAEGAAKAREAQGHVLKGLAETPAMLAKMPEGPARAKASASYRQMMGQLYVKLCEVEQAFLDNKKERVEAIMLELKELKKKGHNEFMEEEE